MDGRGQEQDLDDLDGVERVLSCGLGTLADGLKHLTIGEPIADVIDALSFLEERARLLETEHAALKRQNAALIEQAGMRDWLDGRLQ